MIGENILLTIPKGNAGKTGIERYIEVRQNFIEEFGLGNKPFVEIRDYSLIKGYISKESRNKFTQLILKEAGENRLLGFWGFHANVLISWAYSVATRLYGIDIPVRLVKNYYAAIAASYSMLLSKGLITEEQHRKRKAFVFPDLWKLISKTLEKKDLKRFYSWETIDEYAKDFLSFISQLNWNMENTKETVTHLPQNHPFKPLYHSMIFIKNDFDRITQDLKQKEKELSEMNLRLEEKVKERTVELSQRDILLKEKNTILETSLDILSHDTKNLFFNINNLLNEVEDPMIQSMLKENVDELFGLTMETSSFLTDKKRIFSLVEILHRMRVTPQRIILESCDRIDIQHHAPDQLYVETSVLFKNAIQNLIENALKYTPEGSKVIIQVQRETDNIVLRVVDHGKGIPDEEKEKILDKYYRREDTKEIEGSGRGLWITKNILSRENGKLCIQDNPSGGAIFIITIKAYCISSLPDKLLELSGWFDLPIKRIKQKAQATESLLILQNRKDIVDMPTTIFLNMLQQLRQENTANNKLNIHKRLERLKGKNKGGKKVLIVDDSLYVQYYLAKFFNELGYEILGYADNGQAGIDAYKELSPDFLTLDNTMPVLSGIEAASELYQYDPKVRFLFITGLGDSSQYKERLRKTIPETNYSILTKPIEIGDVKKALHDFIT